MAPPLPSQGAMDPPLLEPGAAWLTVAEEEGKLNILMLSRLFFASAGVDEAAAAKFSEDDKMEDTQPPMWEAPATGISDTADTPKKFVGGFIP